MVCPDKQRTYHLRRLYGITPEQYDELLERQQGKCAVCLKDKEEFNVRLAVDHDHVSGEIRGLLCRYCNHRLVGRHRDSAVLRRIADYLDLGTGWFVPPKKKRRRKTTRSKNVRTKTKDIDS
jgi:DNA-directed RNA polymerase subunit RPC12/RpoP